MTTSTSNGLRERNTPQHTHTHLPLQDWGEPDKKTANVHFGEFEYSYKKLPNAYQINSKQAEMKIAFNKAISPTESENLITTQVNCSET